MMGFGVNFGSGKSIYQARVDSFKGVDFASSPVSVQMGRSPYAVNVISDLAGKPVKRTGYELQGALEGQRINGLFHLKDKHGEKLLVHAKDKLYEWQKDGGNLSMQDEDEEGESFVLLGEGLEDLRSYGIQFDEKMWILDGKQYYCYGFDDEKELYELKKVEDMAYVPTTVIAREPNGSSGLVFEARNLLSRKRKNSFYVDNVNREGCTFQLDKEKLCDDITVSAQILLQGDEWQTIEEGSGLTVNRETGVVTFSVAPGETPVLGEDNVVIEFGWDDEDDGRKKINGCEFGILYDVDGGTNRLFVSGNKDFCNWDFWSEIDDFTYFPEDNYAKLGSEASKIMGYSRQGNALVVHKESSNTDNSVFFRKGTTDDKGNALFPIVSGISGVGAISKYGFAVFNTEPMFVTNEGVFAVTTADVTGEKYAEVRSFYVNPKLVEENLAEAVGVQFRHHYYLAVDGRCYVADSRQKVYESHAPLSSFQYEWYYFENVPARVWFVYEDRLYFGTEDGKIYRFFEANEHSALNNVYQDDGVAIRAIWDTPYFSFNKLGHLKRLVGFWVMLAPYYRSSVNIYYRAGGERKLVRSATADIFTFEDIDFERFSFNVDDSPLVVATNMPLRRFMLIQFRLENDQAEGFGFYGFEAQYVVQGRNR